MTVTIKDVAARAGVSTKTVSRVMNDEAHVRAAVRKAVMRAVDDLGYRPNAFARSLSSARSYLIGLFFDDPASGYAVAMQRGALDRCRQQHYHLVVERLDCREPGWQVDLDVAVSTLRFDGAILAPPLSQSRPLLDALEARGVPVVCVSPLSGAPVRAGVVDIDERQAAYDMTTRLIGLGHRDIGFINGDAAHASSEVRRAGFVEAMTVAGIPTKPDRLCAGDFSFRSGMAAAELLIGKTPRPSAIFASNDDMALGASVAALKLGLDVPRDLAIAGFDDAPTSRIAWPPLTTIRQPVAEMGAAAVAMLIDPEFRRGNQRYYRTRLNYELVERASTLVVGVDP